MWLNCATWLGYTLQCSKTNSCMAKPFPFNISGLQDQADSLDCPPSLLVLQEGSTPNWDSKFCSPSEVTPIGVKLHGYHKRYLSTPWPGLLALGSSALTKMLYYFNPPIPIPGEAQCLQTWSPLLPTPHVGRLPNPPIGMSCRHDPFGHISHACFPPLT